MIYLVVFAVYAVGFWATLGAALSECYASYRNESDFQINYRRDLAMCIAMAMLPIAGWLSILFTAGFYETGWRIRRPSK